jgi:hypothetical protein
VILPDYTERAKKLGELIALYLKGDWNWNDGMQLARQYAPAGTTEAELRAAVIHAAKTQGNTGNLYLRALVQPEVVHPQVNISDLPKQSTLQNIARGLQAPLRSVAAGTTQLAGMINPRGQYGKESGGKPFSAPKSFAESYASDPSFGSALELAFPNMPQWMRVLIGGALDLVLDPTNIFIAAKPVKTAASTVGKTVSGSRAVQAVSQPIKDVAGAFGTRVMHPTAAKQVAKQAPAGEKLKSLRELGEALDVIPVYSFARNVGSDMLELRNRLDDIIRRANEQGANISQSHNILDFEKYVDEIKQSGISNPLSAITSTFTIEKLLKQDLRAIARIEADLRAAGKTELADEVRKLASEIDKRSDNWYRRSERIDAGLISLPRITNNNTLYGAMWEAARAVYRREILPRESIAHRAIDVWKRTKTVYNPATHTRNFFQNFLLRYLTGDVDVADLARLPQAVQDMIRLRRIVEDIASRGGNINIDDLVNQYPELADLAFILAFAREKPPRIRSVRQLRQTIQQLRPGQRIMITHDEWAKLSNLVADPQTRIQQLISALSQHRPSLQDTIRVGTLPQETGIPISQLPRSWWDVIPAIFRRATNIVREAKENKRSAVGAIFQRAYQAEDVIPALLMEAVRRRATLMAGKPYVPIGAMRLDYSDIPETIGLLNIAALPFFSYQYLATKGLKQALRRNPERIYNIVAKPIERSTRITQADEEQGVSQAPRFGFAERELYPVSATRGIPYSSLLPIDPQFAEPFLSPSAWISRSPITAIARPFVENREDVARALDQLVKEFTPATFQHLAYALLGEPQRGMKPALQHTRMERLLRALGINIQPVDAMRIAQQQQRQAERKRTEPLYDDPTSIIQRVLRWLGL